MGILGVLCALGNKIGERGWSASSPRQSVGKDEVLMDPKGGQLSECPGEGDRDFLLNERTN